MAITSQVSQLSFVGNASTSTPYALTNLRFDENSWLTVEEIDEDGVVSALSLGSDFTITGSGTTSSASIVTGGGAIPATSTLRVSRNTPRVQETSFVASGSIPSSTLERIADWHVMALIDEKRRDEAGLSRALRVPDGETVAQLPAADDRAEKFLGFDDDGAPAVFTPSQIAAEFDADLAAEVAAVQAAKTAAESARDEANVARDDAEAAAASIGDGSAVTDKASFLRNLDHSLPVVSNTQALHWFWKQWIPFLTSPDPSGSTCAIGCWGDSMATSHGVIQYVASRMYAKIGMGAITSFTFAGAGTPTVGGLTAVLGGTGASLTTQNYSYLPNAQYWTVPTTGSVTETITDATRRCGFRKLRCWYARRSGGGTIVFTVTQNGAPLSGGAKSVNTGTGTPGTIGYVDFEAADGLDLNGQPSLAVTATTATVHYLGSFLYLRSGFIPIAMGLGNTSLAGQNTVPNANITDFVSAMGISLMLHAFKEEDTTDYSDLEDHMERMSTLLTSVSHVFFGQSPSGTEALDIAASNAMRAKALELGFAFFDCLRVLQSYALMVSLGWNGDGTHLSSDAHKVQAAAFAREILLTDMGADTNKGSVLRPVTHREWAFEDFIRRTHRIANLSSSNQSSSSGSGWTILKDRGSHDISWTTAPVNGDWAGTIQFERWRLHGAHDFAARWQLIENFSGTTAITAKLAFGIAAGYPAATLAGQGLTWELGFDSSTLPWIRFELHDGVTRYQSSKFYLPLQAASGNSGYNTAGTVWHNWALRYEGNNNATKRIRVWCSPSHVGNNNSETVKPSLVADWQQTVGVSNNFPSSSALFCSFAALATGTPTAGNMNLLAFETDFNFARPDELLPLA